MKTTENESKLLDEADRKALLRVQCHLTTVFEKKTTTVRESRKYSCGRLCGRLTIRNSHRDTSTASPAVVGSAAVLAHTSDRLPKLRVPQFLGTSKGFTVRAPVVVTQHSKVWIVMDEPTENALAVLCVCASIEDVLVPKRIDRLGRHDRPIRILPAQEEKTAVLDFHTINLFLGPVFSLVGREQLAFDHVQVDVVDEKTNLLFP